MGGRDSKTPEEGRCSESPDEGGCSKAPGVKRCSKTLDMRRCLEKPAQLGDSKKPVIGARVFIRGVYAGVLACMAMLCISGDAGTAQGSNHGGIQIPWWGQQTEWRLARGISTLHYGTGNDIPAAVMETVMLSNRLAMFQEWDPGVTFSVGEKKMQEDQHIGNRGQRINWMRILDTGQQGVEMVVVEGQQQGINTVDEMYKYESTDEGYVRQGIMEYMIKVVMLDTGQLYESTTEACDTGQMYESTREVRDAGQLYEVWDTGQLYENTTEVWDTGQQAQRIKDASSDDILIDRFAFFGWCTSSRGTNAEEDTTGWRVQADQEEVPGHEGVPGREDVPGGETVPGREEFPGREEVSDNKKVLGCEAKNDAIALKTSFRNTYEQNPSVLEGGGGIIGNARLSLHETEQAYCRVSLRYSTWGQVRASIGTLVGQRSFHELLGWGEVVPLGY